MNEESDPVVEEEILPGVILGQGYYRWVDIFEKTFMQNFPNLTVRI